MSTARHIWALWHDVRVSWLLTMPPFLTGKVFEPRMVVVRDPGWKSVKHARWQRAPTC